MIVTLVPNHLAQQQIQLADRQGDDPVHRPTGFQHANTACITGQRYAAGCVHVARQAIDPAKSPLMSELLQFSCW